MPLSKQGIDHIVVCKRDDDRGWSVITRADGAWHEHSSRQNGLVGWAIDAWLALIAANREADATFTTRSVADLAAEPVIEQAIDLRCYVPGGSVIVLLPERDPQSDLWTQLWSTRGRLYAGGTEPRFRLPTLMDQIRAFFAREGIKSFEPTQRIDTNPDSVPMNRPSCHRELAIRRTWSAAAALPEAFADPAVRAPRLTAQQEADRVRRIRAHREMLEGRERTRRSAESSRAVNEHNAKLAELRSRPKLPGAEGQ